MESYLNFGRNDPNYGFSFRGIKMVTTGSYTMLLPLKY